MIAAVLLMMIADAGIPPLNDDQQALLASAIDGRDHVEPAVWALLDNTKQWAGDLGDAPIRLRVDADALVSNPDARRGELFRVEGVIQSIEPLREPYKWIEAWFVRLESGRPALVYVDFREGRGARERRFSEGDRVSIDARFYKRVDAVDRRGIAQSYPAFVGAWPRAVGGDRGWSSVAAVPPAFLVAATAVLALVFVGVFIHARRVRANGRARAHVARIHRPDSVVDDGATDLPVDPAAALAELRRRSEPAR
jgi:hypothetical protein